MSNHESTENELKTGRLTELARVCARAEARETEAMIGYRDSKYDQIAELEQPVQRQIELAAIASDIGQAMGLSEAQVHGRLASADRVREHTPRVWLAFRDGTINEARLREISSTVELLQRDESSVRLDQSVLAYAQSHTVFELRRWLRQFVDRVETDLAP
ncbi:DUF222 domain-containing protein [Aeromicrobium sp. CF3.5]|uniref:DUF222 domain-containing protein n=1 Tax=Aeromicrobium sp. CF3.5 TaxID=3373078 RepID=UPI003EE5DCBA